MRTRTFSRLAVTGRAPMPIRTGCVIALGLATACAAETASAQGQGPCAQIRAACVQAGFAPRAAREGNGIVADCIRPLMQGTPQPRRASMPLPQVDPQLVDGCGVRHG
jgi:hypothetical protein